MMSLVNFPWRQLYYSGFGGCVNVKIGFFVVGVLGIPNLFYKNFIYNIFYWWR